MTFIWKDLQNGSDIRGVALPGVAGEFVNLTPDVVLKLGMALVTWYYRHFSTDKKLLISVGSDSRLSGPELKNAFCKGLTSMGADVLDFGMATTPSMFMSIVDDHTQCDAAVMITASHLPFNRNGLKFFTSKGGFEKADITELLSIAEKGSFSSVPVQGTLRPFNYIERYADYLVTLIRNHVNHPEYFETPLKGLKIIVDAGNGAGGFFASKVLNALGADTTGSQYLEPDGHFPNHIPNPEDEEAMKSVQHAVLNNKADLGIIFDTDVDRAAIVGKDGACINRNRLIALLAAIVLEEHPETYIVTDSVTSEGLSAFIEKHNGYHLRFKRGYKNVINEALRLNKEGKPCWLAIETSGHAAFKENYFLDDGAFLIAKVLIKLAKIYQQGKSIEKLLENLVEPAEAKEFRIKINDEHFADYGKKVIDALEYYIRDVKGWEKAKDNYEGIRVSCNKNTGNGWFLLRLSLHDPVLPLNIESDEKNGIAIIVNKLINFFNDFSKLDINALLNYTQNR
jgi:phosphomannomutase